MKKLHSNSNEQTQHLFSLNHDSIHIEDLGQEIHCRPGTVLNTSGEIPADCYYLKKGRVLCCETSPSGEQHVYDYVDAGSLFLEEYLLFDRVCPVTYKTMVESELVKIDAESIIYAYQHDFQIVTEICEGLAEKLTAAISRSRLEMKHNAAWKICRMLLFYAQNFGTLTENGSIRIDHTLSQQTLADNLSMNRVTVAKKIKELKELDLIDVRSRHFYIPNVDRIVDYMIEIESGI